MSISRNTAGQGKIILELDPADFKEMEIIIDENKTLKENQKIYEMKDSLSQANAVLLKGKLDAKDEIIGLQKQQIEKLLHIPEKIIDNTKWWLVPVAVIGGVLVGYGLGRIVIK